MKNEKILKASKITVKVLLGVSLVISIGLLMNYIRNLNPTADGFDVTNGIARLIHGDSYWTWEKLTTGVYTSFGIFVALFCVNLVLDTIRFKNIAVERRKI